MKTAEYTPFGEKWKNELMKLPKISIIALYRSLCLKVQESDQIPPEITDEDIEIQLTDFCNHRMSGDGGIIKDIIAERIEGAKWYRSELKRRMK
jgi:hypothetical protein